MIDVVLEINQLETTVVTFVERITRIFMFPFFFIYIYKWNSNGTPTTKKRKRQIIDRKIYQVYIQLYSVRTSFDKRFAICKYIIYFSIQVQMSQYVHIYIVYILVKLFHITPNTSSFHLHHKDDNI